MAQIPELDQIRDAALARCAEVAPALLHRDVPQGAKDAFRDYQSAVQAVIAASVKVNAGYSQLDQEKAGLVPAAYYQDRRQLKSEADEVVREAYLAADQAKQRLIDELAKGAAPKVDSSREILARQELSTALNSGRGTLLERVSRIVNRGGEAASALNSDYGQTLLESLAEPDEVNDALSIARSVALEQAKQTDSPIGQAVAAAEKLDAVGAASTYYGMTTDAPANELMFGDGR